MKKITLHLAAAFFMLLSSHVTFAKVWRVNNNPNHNQHTGDVNHWVFDNLQTAIDDANVMPGDTLYVEASATSYGLVNLSKRIVIIGAGYFLNENVNLQNNTNNSVVSRINLLTGSNGSAIYGMRITGVSSVSLNFQNSISDIIVSRCYIESIVTFASAAGNVNNILINKNYIESAIQAGGTNSLAVSNLIISNNRLNGIGLKSNTAGIISNNVIHNGVSIYAQMEFFNNICLGVSNGGITQNNNTVANMHHNICKGSLPNLTWLSGGNNHFSIAEAAVFSNFTTGTTDKKYELQAQVQCSICYQGYPSNTVMGMYGGNDPYIFSGIPAIPAIYDLTAPINAPQNGVLPVTISTRSNN